MGGSVGLAAVVDDEVVLEPQAASTVATPLTVSPITRARSMNCRRLMRPCLTSWMRPSRSLSFMR